MERQELQKLIASLESLKRVTQKASNLFDDIQEEVSTGWWILDEDER